LLAGFGFDRGRTPDRLVKRSARVDEKRKRKRKRAKARR